MIGGMHREKKETENDSEYRRFTGDHAMSMSITSLVYPCSICYTHGNSGIVFTCLTERSNGISPTPEA
jgi:hypothetical protein